MLILLREYIFYTGCSTGCQMDNLPVSITFIYTYNKTVSFLQVRIYNYYFLIQFAVRFFSDAPVVLLEFFLVLWFLYNIGYDIYLISKPSKTSLVKQVSTAKVTIRLCIPIWFVVVSCLS